MKYILVIIFLGAVGCSTPTLFDHKEQKQFEKDFEQVDKERIKEEDPIEDTNMLIDTLGNMGNIADKLGCVFAPANCDSIEEQNQDR